MATKHKLKVTRVSQLRPDLSHVTATNNDFITGEKLVDLKGKELSAAAAKKLTPNQYRRQRTRTGDRITLTIETAQPLKVGDEFTITL